MSAFDQYKDAATTAATNNGVDPAIFFGLIQSESGWNPTADAHTNFPNSHAYGFTQLEPATASQLGVNARDPIQNLNGGAKYLGGLLHQYNGDYNMALAAYHDGPGAVGLHGGYQYADTVLANAKKYQGDSNSPIQSGWDAISTAVAGGNPIDVVTSIGGAVGGAASSVVGGASGALDTVNNKVDTFVSNLIGSSVKSYIVPIVVGFGAVTVILVSAWGLVKASPGGDTVSNVAKVGARMAFL